MADKAPIVYILHGDDEYGIAQFISKMEAQLGDPANASMNITRIGINALNLNELESATGAMPFLAKRRLVIVERPLGRLNSPSDRNQFKERLEKIPPTTALVLVENRVLTRDADRRKNKLHWLERWGEENKDRAYLRAFPLPKGRVMTDRIQEQARQEGGQISGEAAQRLAGLVDNDPRLSAQEINKLLAYVNYSRAIELDDVELLTADVGQANIFAMVDALGAQNGRKAMGELHRLLEQQDPFSIFGMVVRQFRLLLQTREILDQGGVKNEISKKLRVAPFVADKLLLQARRFNLSVLEELYHRLLDVDESIKTGQMPADLALDRLIATLTH